MFYLLFVFLGGKVSIPYRDDKNSDFLDQDINSLYMFQSLIGTIKTSSLASIMSGVSVFQSLIGTIKTYFFRITANPLTVFQSLIGTIKTFTFIFYFTYLLSFNPL